MLALPGLNFLSPVHMVVILVIALMLFGNRLPEVARSMGRSINEFKRGMRESNDDDEPEAEADPPPEKLGPPRSDANTTADSREREPVESARDE